MIATVFITLQIILFILNECLNGRIPAPHHWLVAAANTAAFDVHLFFFVPRGDEANINSVVFEALQARVTL